MIIFLTSAIVAVAYIVNSVQLC